MWSHPPPAFSRASPASEARVKKEALVLLSALGSPFFVHLELCQATQMVFEMVKD